MEFSQTIKILLIEDELDYLSILEKELHKANFSFVTYNEFLFENIKKIIINESILLKCGSFLLLVTALLYNYNVFKILFYKPKISIHETD